MNRYLQKAIDKVGGPTELSRRLGCSQSMIHYWLHQSKRGVPAEYCQPLENITGIKKKKFRPDIFGDVNA